jgi:hypothetical protein
MFNTVVLDVVIGLVLIYLLYSLFITIIAEIVAARIGLRERVLRSAIERMLNDSYYEKKAKLKLISFGFFRRLFLYESSQFKYSFAGRFYQHPSIKYLSKADKRSFVTLKNTKPSYISSEHFADSLLRLIREKGSGNTDMEKILYSLKYNTIHVQPETLKLLQHIARDAGNDIDMLKQLIKKWYEEMMDRINGWYKRKLNLILFILGFLVAGSFNVDTIRITEYLSTDTDARDQMAKIAIEVARDSARYAGHVKIGNDSVPAKAVLDSSLSRISRDLERSNKVLGLGWEFTELHKSYEKDITDSTRAANIRANEDSLASLKRQAGALKSNITAYDAVIKNLSASVHKAMTDSIRLAYNIRPTGSRIDTLAASPYRIRQEISIRKAERVIDSLELSRLNDSVASRTEMRKALISGRLRSLDKIDTLKKGHGIRITGKRSYYWYEKVLHVLGNMFGFDRSMLGFMITALALSLGAPFWFDLLRKLVSIRTGGVKPEEKPQTASNTGDAPPTPAGKGPAFKESPPVPTPPSEKALKEVSSLLKKEPGIVTVALEFNDQSNPILAVMVQSAAVTTYLNNKYGATVTVGNEAIPIRYTVETENSVRIGTAGGEIGNANGALGKGTLGCFLKKQGTNTPYIISCWHVMKDNTDWRAAVINASIIGSTSDDVIANVEEGCLSNCLDVGLAACNAKQKPTNNVFPVKSQHRAVTQFDALVKTPVKLIGKVAGPVLNARIFHYMADASLLYADGNTYLIEDVFSISILDANNNPVSSGTSAGDSGAVVVDNNHVPLGMIIGGNDKFSYAVKFTNMFDKGQPYQEFSFITS